MPRRLPVGEVRPIFPTDSDYLTLALLDWNREHRLDLKFDELVPSEQSAILRAAQRLKSFGPESSTSPAKGDARKDFGPEKSWLYVSAEEAIRGDREPDPFWVRASVALYRAWSRFRQWLTGAGL